MISAITLSKLLIYYVIHGYLKYIKYLPSKEIQEIRKRGKKY